MTFTEFISAIGLCFGLAGFVLGVLNYLRDRHRINITLQWGLCRFQQFVSKISAIDVQFADSGWAGRHLAGRARLAGRKNGRLWMVAPRHCGGAFREPDLTHRRSTKSLW